jgi:hypothetical protein
MIALMMEAARTSETLLHFYQTTWRYNPEDSHRHLPGLLFMVQLLGKNHLHVCTAS